MSLLGLMEAITQSDGLVGKLIEGTKELIEHAIEKDQQDRLVKAQVEAQVAKQRELDALKDLKEAEHESAQLGAQVMRLKEVKKGLQDKLAAAEEKAFTFEKMHNDRVNQEGRDRMVTELGENPYKTLVRTGNPIAWETIKVGQCVRAYHLNANGCATLPFNDYKVLQNPYNPYETAVDLLYVQCLDAEEAAQWNDGTCAINPTVRVFYALNAVENAATNSEPSEDTTSEDDNDSPR